MARLALTPQVASYNGVVLNYQAMTGYTGVSWSNTGREILLVNLGATATTETENIGVSVLGQAVTALTVTPGTSAITPIRPVPLRVQPAELRHEPGLDRLLVRDLP